MGAPKKADWREERRKRAWKLKEQGWRQKDIAAALGVSEGAVSQWLKRGRVGGIEALKAHPSKGMTPRLAPEQKAQLPALLAKGAEAYGFRGDVRLPSIRSSLWPTGMQLRVLAVPLQRP